MASGLVAQKREKRCRSDFGAERDGIQIDLIVRVVIVVRNQLALPLRLFEMLWLRRADLDVVVLFLLVAEDEMMEILRAHLRRNRPDLVVAKHALEHRRVM